MTESSYFALLNASRSAWPTAIHEAGHSVTARVLQFPCGGATVIPDYAEGWAGHAAVADPQAAYGAWDQIACASLELGRHARFRDVCVAYRVRAITGMAGAEAELECSAGEGLGDGDDRYWISLALEHIEIPDQLTPRYEQRLRTRTRALVRRHRITIERVAQALHDGG